MNIVFYFPKDFDGSTLRNRPLGGVQTSVIHLAHELQALGNEVFVGCQGSTGIWNDVKYFNLQRDSAEFIKYINYADVFISVRSLEPFIIGYEALKPPLKIFFTGDAHFESFNKVLHFKELQARIDKFFLISEWQASTFRGAFGIPQNKIWVTRNGIHAPDFNIKQPEYNRKRLVYTSTPFRGLDILLALFPHIKEKEPEAELHIYSGMQVYGYSNEQNEQAFGQLYQIAREMDGVKLYGNLIQKKLAKELLTCGIFAYPCTFPETSCIAVIEAQAVGLPIVTSTLGALPETAFYQVLIPGMPWDTDFQALFIEKILWLMKDKQAYRTFSDIGTERVYPHYTWKKIAQEWDGQLKILYSKK